MQVQVDALGMDLREEGHEVLQGSAEPVYRPRRTRQPKGASALIAAPHFAVGSSVTQLLQFSALARRIDSGQAKSITDLGR